MSDTEVMALSGLRRLVVHARDGLKATQARLPVSFAYSEAWTPGQIRRHAAQALAEQTLTLVLDCLPASDSVSADEVAEIREGYDRDIKQIDAELTQVRELSEARFQEIESLSVERDDAVSYQAGAEDEAQLIREVWDEVRTLALTDVPAAVKRLTAGLFPEADAKQAS